MIVSQKYFINECLVEFSSEGLDFYSPLLRQPNQSFSFLVSLLTVADVGAVLVLSDLPYLSGIWLSLRVWQFSTILSMFKGTLLIFLFSFSFVFKSAFLFVFKSEKGRSG